MAYPIKNFGSAPFEIIDGDRGKAYPKQSEFRPSGYCLFLSATNVTKAGFDFGSGQFIDEHKDLQLRKGKLQREDVVLTTRGTIGNVAHYNARVPFEHVRINSGMVILRCDQQKILPRYLYAYLRSGLFRGQVERMRSGVAQPQLPIRDMKWIEIPLPTPSQQERLVEVIAAYDDLIENNRRRIALLEEAVRLLYREWFVHFRFPGYEHVKIINGIPEGWMMQSVGDLAKIKGGKQLGSTLIRAVGPVSVYGGNGIQGYTDKKIYDGFVIVFGRVGANCGSVHWSYDGAWINNNASGLVPHQHPELLLHHMLNCNFVNYRKGAAQPFIPNGVLSTIRFSTPHENLASLFCEYARTIRLQQVTLNQQNQKLAQARDLLLPRLMNGEIAV